VIDVSKQPYYYCETWFEAMNIQPKNMKFVLAAGHKKVPSGWRPSELEEGDKKVITKDFGDGGYYYSRSKAHRVERFNSCVAIENPRQ
jgi:hypothetical protein